MPFTDNDLKDLNYWLQFPDGRCDTERIKALIGRLEVAERVVEELDAHFLSDKNYVERLIEYWRKAAGK